MSCLYRFLALVFGCCTIGLLLFSPAAMAIPFPASNAPEVQWDRYFRWFGQQEKDKQIQTNPVSRSWTNNQWAAYLAGKVGDMLAAEGYLPNTNRKERVGDIALARYNQGRCEHCVKNVGAALAGVNIPYQTVIATRSGDITDPNRNHSWIVVETKPGSRSYHAIDLWLHGREKSTFANMASTPLASAGLMTYWHALEKESYKWFQLEENMGNKNGVYTSVDGFSQDQFEIKEQKKRTENENRLKQLLQLKYRNDPFRAATERREIQKSVRAQTEKKVSDKVEIISDKQNSAAEEDVEEEIDIYAGATQPEEEAKSSRMKRRTRAIQNETQDTLTTGPVPEGDLNGEGENEEEQTVQEEDSKEQDESGTAFQPAGREFDGEYRGADKSGNVLRFTITDGIVNGEYWHIRFAGKVDVNGHIKAKGKGFTGEYTNEKQTASDDAIFEYQIVADISGDIVAGEVQFMIYPQGKKAEAAKGSDGWSAARQ